MRTFDSLGQVACGICKEVKEGKGILVQIDGTQEDNICEAQPIHLDCINLRFNKDEGLFYQKINPPK